MSGLCIMCGDRLDVWGEELDRAERAEHELRLLLEAERRAHAEAVGELLDLLGDEALRRAGGLR